MIQLTAFQFASVVLVMLIFVAWGLMMSRTADRYKRLAEKRDDSDVDKTLDCECGGRRYARQGDGDRIMFTCDTCGENWFL